MNKKALVIEDDKNIAELLRLYLEKDGFEVGHSRGRRQGPAAGDGRASRTSYSWTSCCPVMDGWQVCREVRTGLGRAHHHAHRQGRDLRQGLRPGAGRGRLRDEALRGEGAHRAHTRRACRRRRGRRQRPAEKKLEFHELVINLDSYELIVDGKKVDTPPKELELLYHLAAIAQPGLHPQPAAGRGLGLRLFRRQPHRGRAYKAPAGEAGGRLGRSGRSRRSGAWATSSR